MSKQEYTVFADRGTCHGFENSTPTAAHDCTLQGIIAWYVGQGYTPVAWAPELTRSYGGKKHSETLRAESIAAGRLIEKTASGWVALGAEKQEESDLPELVKNFQQRELRKGEPTSADLAMIARDEPKTFRLPKRPTFVLRAEQAAPASAKTNPFPTTLRSPDCDSGPSDHLNASRHQMAGMSKS